MFSVTEAPFVARRSRYYVVTPQQGRWTLADYCRDEDAVPLDEPFEYQSGTNAEWLTVPDIQALVQNELGVAG